LGSRVGGGELSRNDSGHNPEGKRYFNLTLPVWMNSIIYGVLIIGFIAQLFVSLIKFEIPELRHTSTKFIKKSLSNLTVTVDLWMRKTKKYIYSNFEPINTMILRYNWTIS